MSSSALSKFFESVAEKENADTSTNRSLTQMSRRIDKLEEENEYLKLSLGELEETVRQLQNGM